MRVLDQIKAFGMTNQMLTEDLRQLGMKLAVDLGHAPKTAVVEDTYYPQFSAAVRAEASEMGRHYVVFYCLERTIRDLVSATFETAEKSDQWWLTKVPAAIQVEVASRIQKEMDAAVTKRSTHEIDYTTFGELSVIITSNWSIFEPLFNSKKAVEKVMANLNSLRNPIAHCAPLADDEVTRLEITVRDWFRLME